MFFYCHCIVFLSIYFIPLNSAVLSCFSPIFCSFSLLLCVLTLDPSPRSLGHSYSNQGQQELRKSHAYDWQISPARECSEKQMCESGEQQRLRPPSLSLFVPMLTISSTPEHHFFFQKLTHCMEYMCVSFLACIDFCTSFSRSLSSTFLWCEPTRQHIMRTWVPYQARFLLPSTSTGRPAH